MSSSVETGRSEAAVGAPPTAVPPTAVGAEVEPPTVVGASPTAVGAEAEPPCYLDVVRRRVEEALALAAELPDRVERRRLQEADLSIARDECLGSAARRGLLLVGGEAVDRALPAGRKIYGEGEHRDVDFLSRRSSKLEAATLMKRLEDLGLPASMHPALHAGTWAVKVHRRVVADVTEVSAEDFESLSPLGEGVPRGAPQGVGGRRGGKSRRRGGGGAPPGPGAGPAAEPAAVPTGYLKMSIHQELSRPAGHCRRWATLYPRLRALYEEFPPAVVPRVEETPRRAPHRALAPLLESARRLCRRGAPGSVLLAGVPAAGEILGGCPAGRVDVALVTEDDTDGLCLAIRLASEAEAVCLERGERCPALLTDGPRPAGVLLPSHSSVRGLDGAELARVYCSPEPLASAGCGWVASVDVVLFLMHGELLSGRRRHGGPAGSARRAGAASSVCMEETAGRLAAEMLRREDASDCEGPWRRMASAVPKATCGNLSEAT